MVSRNRTCSLSLSTSGEIGGNERDEGGSYFPSRCALAYFAKVLQSHSNDDGFAPLTVIPYVDYCTTCPLLTLDLLWCLDAPYKISSAVLVFTCLVIAVACSLAVAPFSYCWFAMGMVLFTFTYVFILSIVRQRLDFFTLCARDSNAKQSLK